MSAVRVSTCITGTGGSRLHKQFAEQCCLELVTARPFWGSLPPRAEKAACMYARRRVAGLILLIGIPVLMGALWLVSGRETFTKWGRSTQVLIQDPLFGDTFAETRFVRGPIFGYYVGLDLFLLSVLAAVVLGAIWWWLARRRRRVTHSAQGKPA
jgi:hypothetical protein